MCERERDKKIGKLRKKRKKERERERERKIGKFRKKRKSVRDRERERRAKLDKISSIFCLLCKNSLSVKADYYDFWEQKRRQNQNRPLAKKTSVCIGCCCC